MRGAGRYLFIALGVFHGKDGELKDVVSLKGQKVESALAFIPLPGGKESPDARFALGAEVLL